MSCKWPAATERLLLLSGKWKHCKCLDKLWVILVFGSAALKFLALVIAGAYSAGTLVCDLQKSVKNIATI